jgi:hypothetical protein
VASVPDTVLQSSTSQARLIQLLDYIEHVEKLNRKPAFTVPQDFFCRYEADLRGVQGLEFDLADDGHDTWLRISPLSAIVWSGADAVPQLILLNDSG